MTTATDEFDICVGNSVSGQIIMQISVNLDPYVTLRLPVETAEKLRVLLNEAVARANDH